MKLTTNHTMSDGVSGTTKNLAKGGTIVEPLLEEKQSSTPFQKLIRQSYGISKISNAKSLQTLRNDARSLQSDLNNQVEEMNASIGAIEDPLDRLAQRDVIELVKEQVVKLDSVLDAVGNRVTELLKV